MGPSRENAAHPASTAIWPHFRRIVGQSLIYGTGNIATGFLHLAVVVVLTRFLTREGYGAYENAFVWFLFLTELFILGLGSSLFRYYNLVEEGEERRTVVSTALVAVVLVCLASNIVIFFARERIGSILYGDASYGSFLMLASVAAGLMVPARLGLVYIRILERPVFYTAVVIARVGAILLGIYIFVIRMDMAVLGAILSLLLSNLLLAAILIPWLISCVGLGFSRKLLRGMLSFGIPYIPAGISMWALSLSDRYLLTHFVSLEAVGLYSVAYRMGMAMALLLAGFQLAWPQFAYSLEHAEEGDAVYSRTLTYLFAVMMGAGLFLSLFREELIRFVATADYLQAAHVIPFVAFAYSFEAIFTITSLGAVFHHRTLYVALATLVAAAANILLNVILIPRLGITGAACSTTVSYILLALLMARFSKQFRNVPYEWSRMVKVAVVALLLILASFLIHHRAESSPGSLRPVSDVLLFLLFLPGLYLVRFFRKAEVLRAKEVFFRIVRRTREEGRR
jgi:O-antigen/teichoic acid export membrane protein